MRGDLIDAPRILLPVIKMPHAAPMTCLYDKKKKEYVEKKVLEFVFSLEKKKGESGNENKN